MLLTYYKDTKLFILQSLFNYSILPYTVIWYYLHSRLLLQAVVLHAFSIFPHFKFCWVCLPDDYHPKVCLGHLFSDVFTWFLLPPVSVHTSTPKQSYLKYWITASKYAVLVSPWFKLLFYSPSQCNSFSNFLDDFSSLVSNINA